MTHHYLVGVMRSIESLKNAMNPNWRAFWQLGSKSDASCPNDFRVVGLYFFSLVFLALLSDQNIAYLEKRNVKDNAKKLQYFEAQIVPSNGSWRILIWEKIKQKYLLALLLKQKVSSLFSNGDLKLNQFPYFYRYTNSWKF